MLVALHRLHHILLYADVSSLSRNLFEELRDEPWQGRGGERNLEKILGARTRINTTTNPIHTLCPVRDLKPGPGCIKQLEIKWDFVQLFSVFPRIFSHRHCVFHTLLSTFS